MTHTSPQIALGRSAVLCSVLLGISSADPAGHSAPAYSVIVVEEMLGRVTILNAQHPERRVSLPVGYKPHEISVSFDGQTAFVTNFGLNDAENRDGIPGDSITVIAQRRGL